MKKIIKKLKENKHLFRLGVGICAILLLIGITGALLGVFYVAYFLATTGPLSARIAALICVGLGVAYAIGASVLS